MQFGVTFPRDGLNNDPAQIRDFVQAAETLGFDYVACSDHVVGRAGLEDSARPVLDPMTLLSHIAAVTSKIGLVCGIMVLPQRQTVLVAKQAASIDVLSGGRLRLHLSVGWNELEYESLGQDFHNRGRRMTEAIGVMRALWTQESIEFNGEYHTLSGAGINPMPIQRPIPVWMAGFADAALKRVARLGDGWIPQGGTLASQDGGMAVMEEALAKVRAYLAEAGRDPARFGLQGSLGAQATPDEWQKSIERWRGLGATIMTLTTSRSFLPLGEHIAAMRRFKESGLTDG